MAPTTPLFTSGSCNGTCADTSPHRCADEWDYSLAGDCVSGACVCDAWATGDDCSYLNMLPVDPTRLGYLDPVHSSWGGTVLHSAKDQQWHMLMAEIACPNSSWGHPTQPGKAGGQTRCGLGNWGGSSQVAHAVASHPAGPYKRKALVLGQVNTTVCQRRFSLGCVFTPRRCVRSTTTRRPRSRPSTEAGTSTASRTP